MEKFYQDFYLNAKNILQDEFKQHQLSLIQIKESLYESTNNIIQFMDTFGTELKHASSKDIIENTSLWIRKVEKVKNFQFTVKRNMINSWLKNQNFLPISY